jgi:hypothetical protein
VHEEGLDPREFLERLQGQHQTIRWMPLPPDEAAHRLVDNPAVGEPSLGYLHEHWVLPDGKAPDGARGGLRGRVAAAVARPVFRLLRRYFDEERELLSRMVQMHDALATRCDDLARALAEREVAEAENLAQLAAWLQSAAPQAAPQFGDPART